MNHGITLSLVLLLFLIIYKFKWGKVMKVNGKNINNFRQNKIKYKVIYCKGGI